MNTTRLFTALALTLAAAGSAMAQEATYDYPQTAPSAVSRAAVKADLQQARADGSLMVTELDYQKAAPSRTTLTREAVKAQTLAAIASGELQALNRDSNGVEVRTARPTTRAMGMGTATAPSAMRHGG